MNAFAQSLAIFAILASTTAAFAGPTVKPGLKPQTPIEHFSNLAEESLGRPLSEDEANMIKVRFSEAQEAFFNQSNLIKVGLDNEDKSSEVYMCLGGKAALVAIALEGFKCISLSTSKIVTVTFSSERLMPEVTGLIPKGYFGITAGVALNLGVMVLRQPSDAKADSNPLGGRYSYTERGIKGGKIDAAYFGGLLVGYYEKDNTSATIIALQAGFSLGAALSDIQITEERN